MSNGVEIVNQVERWCTQTKNTTDIVTILKYDIEIPLKLRAD